MNRQNFHLFLQLKEHLAGKSSTMMTRCKKKSWRGSKCRQQTSMTRGIQNLVQRLNKCLDSAGDYVEKWSYVQTVHSQCHSCKLKMLYMFKTFVSFFPDMPCILTDQYMLHNFPEERRSLLLHSRSLLSLQQYLTATMADFQAEIMR